MTEEHSVTLQHYGQSRPSFIQTLVCTLKGMITKEKLDIFNKYGGDDDGLTRVGKNHEKQLYDNDDWGLISSFYLDIEIIKKGLAAKSYVAKFLEELKCKCDSEAYTILISDIPIK